MSLREDLCVRAAEIHVGSAPILECAPQAAGHLGNIRLTSSDSMSRRTLVFRIQIATNEARNALPSFRGQWTRTSEFDQLLLNAGNGKQEPDCDQIALGDSVCQLFKPHLSASTVSNKQKRGPTPAGRRRLSLMMKKRWADGFPGAHQRLAGGRAVAR